MFRGKKYKESAKLIDRAVQYDAKDAFDLLIKAAKAKFDETVELHIKLGVDSRHADQQVRGAIVLPHGTGKTARVLIFCKPERQKEALDAGADFVGAEDMVQKIQSENFFDYDVVVATPDMMSVVGRLGRILGPKGLMLRPKPERLPTISRRQLPKSRPVKSSTGWTKRILSTARSGRYPLALTSFTTIIPR